MDHMDKWAACNPIFADLDAQAALKRIWNDDTGPGQWLARPFFRQAGWTTEFRWIPGHKVLERNEGRDPVFFLDGYLDGTWNGRQLGGSTGGGPEV
jgi:hypothetical protein